MGRTNQTVRTTALYQPLANQMSSVARNRVNAYRMLGVATTTRTAMMTAMRRIAIKRNAIHGCSPAAMVDASTTHGDAV